jgi:iron(III) transport system substrate-binding protein
VATQASAAEPITAYCPMSEDDCRSVLAAFKRDTGVDSRFVRLGAGEIVARIRAERSNPRASLWLAGAADNFIQAAGEGLLEAHESKNLARVKRAYTDDKRMWTPISMSPIVFAYNDEQLKRLGAKPPTSWKDYAAAVFRQQLALAHPAASGTAYVSLATMVQIYGEDEAFKLMRAINENVVQYTRSGSAPSRMASTGEVAIAMAFSQDVEAALEQGYKLGFSAPVEGTGFEINAAALIANAPADQRAGTRAFLDWVLSDAGQGAMAATFRGAVVSGHVNPKAKIDTAAIKVIDYNAAWAGENRARLLRRFEQEVRNASAAR